ncbi:hypothetical protein SRABI83_04525 [Arthrobacter sp. Bi83]|nr:hypothetical protein SRABI83_04525 [Arthrobacter sp. Bi83]
MCDRGGRPPLGLRRHVADDVGEEGVAPHPLAPPAFRPGDGALPPVSDVPPAGRRERAPDFLDGQRGAQVREPQPVTQRPTRQAAHHERRPEAVPGPRGIVGGHRQGRHPFLLAGLRVHGHGSLLPQCHHGHGHTVCQRVQGGPGILLAGEGHGLALVGHEGVEVPQILEPGVRPLAAGIPAHVAEQLHAGVVRRQRPGLKLVAEVRHCRQCGRGLPDQLGGRHRRGMPVGHHGPVVVHTQGHRHRRMPARNAPRQGQIHVLLPGKNLPVVVPVAVVTERRRKARPQAQPGGRDGLVRHAPGAASHPFAPDFGPGLGRVRQSRENDVLEHRPGQQQVKTSGRRRSDGRERIEAACGNRIHVRHTTPWALVLKPQGLGVRPGPAVLAAGPQR